jgi:hypothetical protein
METFMEGQQLLSAFHQTHHIKMVLVLSLLDLKQQIIADHVIVNLLKIAYQLNLLKKKLIKIHVQF